MKKERFNLKNAASTMMLIVVAAMMALSFSSCEKENEEGQEIPGLGSAEGELTGTPFTFPAGIECGEIRGASYSYSYWSMNMTRSFVHKDGTVETLPPLVQTRADEDIYYYGSGPGYVDLVLPLKNITANPIQIEIPAATILVSKAGDCQNGVLIKKVTFSIPANSEIRLVLSFYCGNSSKSTAGTSDIYILGVVSNSRVLLDLCDRVKNKKINLEEFSRSSSSDRSTYNSQRSALQSIVWNVTDYGHALTESDKAYISALPNSN